MSRKNKSEDPNRPTEETTTRMLPCKIKDVEIIEHAREQSALLNQLEAIKSEKKAAIGSYNKNIKDIEKALKIETAIITDGTMDAEVKCTSKYFWDIKEFTVTRNDTGELIEKDEIPESKYQNEMDFPI